MAQNKRDSNNDNKGTWTWVQRGGYTGSKTCSSKKVVPPKGGSGNSRIVTHSIETGKFKK